MYLLLGRGGCFWVSVRERMAPAVGHYPEAIWNLWSLGNHAPSREVAEETGLRVISSRPLTFTNDIFAKENKHYITIFILATVADGEAQILEPDKSNEWRWCDWDNLPRPLFLPLENLLSQGFNLEEYL